MITLTVLLQTESSHSINQCVKLGKSLKGDMFANDVMQREGTLTESAEMNRYDTCKCYMESAAASR